MLGVYLLLLLPYGVLFARRGIIKHHRGSMTAILVVALVLAGLFTLDTGRIMNKVFFGS